MDSNQSSESKLIRLSKLMSERGLCSRREADELIQRGLVFVNGERVSVLGTKVSPEASITLDTQVLERQNKLATILVNKPIGFVSAQPEKGYLPAVTLIRPENQMLGQKRKLKEDDFDGLAVVGRLDIDSQGLLIFTQDGRLAKKIIGEDTDIEKEYLVRVSGLCDEKVLSQLRFGLQLDGDALKPAQVDRLNPDQLRIVLKEGKKRQIRRMCEMVGLQIQGLKRVRVGRLRLGNLPEGQWRYLEPNEEI